MTAVKALQRVREAAEKIKSDELQKVGALAPGEGPRQGDVYLEQLAKKPRRATMDVVLQLAPGSTKGSRHILDSSEGVTMWPPEDTSNPLAGPIFALDKPRTVTHPEHGDWELPAGTVWRVRYQRQYADELKRVRD